MKKLMTGIIFIACSFTLVGWGSTYGNNGHQSERDKGYEEADTRHQGDDENVKRAQGDDRGRKDIHDNKNHQDEEKGQEEDRV